MVINKFQFITENLKEKPVEPDKLCPESVCFRFDPFESKDLRFKNRIYLTVWACISYRHLRDQNFNDEIEDFVKEIEEEQPTTYQEFKEIVSYSSVSRYGNYGNLGFGLRDDFWKQLWIYVKQQLFKDSIQEELFKEEKLIMKIKIEKTILI